MLLHAEQVRCLLQLIQLGTFDKVRRCKQCSTWHVARRSDQRFCSGNCRWNAFASNPKFKAERRDKAKKLYRLHSSGKVSSSRRRFETKSRTVRRG